MKVMSFLSKLCVVLLERQTVIFAQKKFISTAILIYQRCPLILNNRVVLRCGLIITNGQSNLRTGLIAAAHGQFTNIRQVATVCISPNTRFLGPTRVKLSNGISIGSAVLHSSRHRVALLYNEPSLFPLKLPLPMRELDLHQIYVSLGPPESSTQRAPRSVQPFCRARYCDRQTDRPTNRPRYSVSNNKTHHICA